MGRSFLRRLFARSLRDIEPGDCVRVAGYRGVCFVREINDDMAVVVWAKDCRDIVPVVALRRIKPGGHALDRRDA